jgi:small-conductance mechanosensitive channel
MGSEEMVGTSGAPARRHIVRALAALVVAVGALLAGLTFGQLRDRDFGAVRQLATPTERAIRIACLVLVVVAGIVAVRALAAAIRAAMHDQESQRHVAPLGLVISFFGYAGIGICVIAMLERPVGGLLLGGALTGVLLGIAAQQVLANFFAGLVLLIVRPFTIADDIVLRSGPLGGEYEGLVTDMGLFYVKLHTHTGPVVLPNAGVLASAVGPGVRAAEDKDDEDEDDEHGGGSEAEPASGGRATQGPS